MNHSILYCSIGENCLAQGVLDRHKLNSIVSPFAWARSNIDYLLAIIEEDFKDFLNPCYLQHRTRYKTTLATNSKYSCDPNAFDPSVSQEFEFTHHDVLTSKDALQSMERKVDRFRTMLRSSEPVVFLYHHRAHFREESILDKLKTLHTTIKERRANNFLIVAFTQKVVNDDSLRKLSLQRHDEILMFTFHTRKLWGGSDKDVFWGTIDDDLFEEMIAAIK